MNIGDKIKKIRLDKMITQKELAGSEITRNMLSKIENNVALPSLPTVAYLAKRLGVPTGYLLSEGDDEFIYNKTSAMKNIKSAYINKNYEICIDLCQSNFEEFDDELELILTDCYIELAEENIRDGLMYNACHNLDRAVIHLNNTVYNTVNQKNRILLMFWFLKNISPTLDSNEIDTNIDDDLLHPALFGDVFSKYIVLVNNIGRHFDVDNLMFNSKAPITEYDKLLIAHLRARQYIKSREYTKAIKTLRSIMDGDTVPQKLLLYFACVDMELCCRETEDYKGAYEFSNNKMEILEHMLTER